jgi:hypothetical protein
MRLLEFGLAAVAAGYVAFGGTAAYNVERGAFTAAPALARPGSVAHVRTSDGSAVNGAGEERPVPGPLRRRTSTAEGARARER